MSAVTSDKDGTPIRDTVKLIQQMMSSELFMQLYVEDKVKYTHTLRAAFPTFAEEYHHLFKKIINHDDLSMLEPMLSSIEALSKGTKTDKEITTDIGEKLAEKYLYPTFGKPPPKDD